ncbi:acetylornithine deacetylase/succinyl-diaminopimelate desuccinylase family protein [Paenibacillus rhizosphaerae]|uniref:Probable succinyl-diaminopimelate desuccinylase n=1 Tax=Paenibacillus rhizosphaerae TaxID=297318 RepID=A0A839TWN9_9BACL|nr:M20 family metallopeptidase [Paenibacillus rhizosphaerae]MBB3129087.1 acetylornithine deacetylase/succinyl-diaminopimelate desuccinylase family protein [Paenibacillus rhizosphaerae]
MEKDLDSFHGHELLDIVCGLIRIPSENPPGREEAAARYVLKLLRDEGIEAELQWAAPQRPNVVARLKGTAEGPALLYNGHLDVVPAGEGWSEDPFAAVVRGGEMIGRGAADMKSGVAAMLYAAILLHRRGCPFAGELLLLFNVDEERENAGMRHFLRSGVHADYAVIGEPTGLGICTAHKGVGRYRIRTAGVAGHAAKVLEPDNAIPKMAALISALEPLRSRLKESADPLLGYATLNVTQIKGGTAPNIVPQHCEIEVDRRVIPGETAEQVLKQLKEALNAASGAGVSGGLSAGAGSGEGLGEIAGEVTYEVDDYLFIPASTIPQDHELVQALVDATCDVLGKPSAIGIFEATCEAPFLSIDRGIPTIIFGPGSLDQAHVKDERVPVRQIADAAKVYMQLAMRLLQQQPLQEE